MMPPLRRKAEINQKECVACGACSNICPKNAITIYKGMYASVTAAACVGCGKCIKSCPASVITLVNEGVA